MSLKVLVVLFGIFCCAFAMPENTERTSASLCDVCQFLVGFVEGEVVNKEIPVIEQYLEDVCNVLPQKIQTQCRAIVSQYGQELITYIMSVETPAVACRQLSLCKPGNFLEDLQTTLKESRPFDNNVCSECQTVVFFAKIYLDTNSTIDQIEAIARILCQDLSGKNYQQCLTLFNVGLQYVINYIENTDPKDICTALKLCPPSVTLPLRHPALSGTECTICEWVVNIAEGELLSPKVEEPLTAFAQQLCNVFPTSYKRQCLLAVSELVPQLLAQLVSLYPPKFLCTSIGLCDPSMTKVQKL